MDQIIVCEDGSCTVFKESVGECFHSQRGAYSESEYVFLKNGLYALPHTTKFIRILEVGFGTGLNALMTWEAGFKQALKIDYSTLEPYPIELSLVERLTEQSSYLKQNSKTFLQMHQIPFEEKVFLTPHFSFLKSKTGVANFKSTTPFDLIYFDAFSPKRAPQMWTEPIFERLFQILNPNGLLITYCAQGAFRRTLKAVGFQVEKLPGILGKREITRARKII